MLLREKDGKTIKYEIAYFNGGLSHTNRDAAVEIHPDEEYWEHVMGLREAHDLDPNGWEAEIVDFVNKYWVRKELFRKIVEKCNTLGIHESHAHNLAIPISDFGMAKLNMLGSDIQFVAKESVALKEMFLGLFEEPLLSITAIKFELGYGPLGDGKGGIKFLNKRTVSIKNYRALMPLMAELRRLLQSDDQFRSSVLNPTVAHFDDYSYPKTMRSNQDSYLVDVYHYLLHVNVAKSAHEAGAMAWQLMSLVNLDYEDEVAFSASQKVFEGYGQYHAYAGDKARKKIKTYVRNMEINS